jgi:hypothetical protein
VSAVSGTVQGRPGSSARLAIGIGRFPTLPQRRAPVHLIGDLQELLHRRVMTRDQSQMANAGGMVVKVRRFSHGPGAWQEQKVRTLDRVNTALGKKINSSGEIQSPGWDADSIC